MASTSRWKSVALYALLFALSFLYISLGITRALNIYDEGLILFGAQRVVWGQVPYRDFWTVYSPGQFYALAGLFRLFGSSILVARLWDTLFRAALAVIGFALTKRLSSGFFATLGWLFVTLWLGFYEFYGYPVYASLFFVLVSIYALVSAIPSDRPARWLLAAGISLGIATLFRHDFGAYGLAAELVVFIPIALTTPGLARGQHPLRALVKLGYPYILGAAGIVLPAVALLLAAVPPASLWSDLVIFPTTIFPVMRALPYPALFPSQAINRGLAGLVSALPQAADQWPYYFPYFILVLAVLYLGIRFVRLLRRSPELRDLAQFSGVALLILFAAASINQSRTRADLIHLVQLLIVSFVLCFTLAGIVWRANKFVGVIAILIAGVCLLPFEQLIVNERVQLAERGIWAATPNMDHQIAVARGMPVNPEQAAAVRYVQRIVPDNVPLYVGLSRHDRIFVNDALFYFLAGRQSATRYNELHPGVATTQPVQEEIIADLEARQVPVVVIFSMFENVVEPNGSGKSSNVRTLDTYLQRAFEPGPAFGRFYRVLTRLP